MKNIFSIARIFNQPLYNWNISKVKNIYYMFWLADSFNQNLYSCVLVKNAKIYMYFCLYNKLLFFILYVVVRLHCSTSDVGTLSKTDIVHLVGTCLRYEERFKRLWYRTVGGFCQYAELGKSWQIFSI